PNPRTLAAESTGVVNIPLTRVGDLTTTVHLQVVLTNGTATPAVDFEVPNPNLIFSPGETNKVLSISLLPDAHDEPEETIQVVLIPDEPKVLIVQLSAGIVDAPVLEFAKDFYEVNELVEGGMPVPPPTISKPATAPIQFRVYPIGG